MEEEEKCTVAGWEEEEELMEAEYLPREIISVSSKEGEEEEEERRMRVTSPIPSSARRAVDGDVER